MATRRGLVLLAVGLVSSLLPACHPPRAPNSSAESPALSRGAIRRTLIKQQPAADLPGWETRLYLIEYGPSAVAPLHVHPMVGVGFVLDGSFESAFGDEAPLRVHAGQGFVDPARVPHRIFRNLSQDRDLRFVIAYTIRVGQPIFYSGASVPEVVP